MDIEFVTCLKYQSRTWHDLLALGDLKNTLRFECKRCAWRIKLGNCKNCQTSSWKRLNEVHEKGGRQPIVRYQCRGCQRIVGLFLDTV